MECKNLKPRKKVAILISNLTNGGAERAASELSQFLREEGHEIFIFTEKKGTHYVFAGKIVLLKPKRILDELTDLIFLAKEIKCQKKKYQIDVSISFGEEYNLANVLSRRKDKVIIRICTTLSARKDLQGLYYNKRLLYKIYNKADKVIVLSPYGKRDMIENYRIKKKKLMIIPNAVIPRDFDKGISWDYGDKIVLSVNRLHPVKQQGILIDAMREVIKTIPNAKLLLVGSDTNPYANKLKKYVQKENLSDFIIFVGKVNNVEYYMQNSQVFVITSVTEGFPNVVLEAMNQGMPIISTDFIGPMRSILGVSSELGYGKYGMIVPQIDESKKDERYLKNVKILSSTMIEVLNNRDILEKYSRASKNRAKHFSKEKIKNLWRSII